MYRNNINLLNNTKINDSFDHNNSSPYYNVNGKTKIFYNEDDGYVEYDDDVSSTAKINGPEKIGYVFLTKLSGFMVMISQLPLPKLSVNGMGIAILFGTFFLPRIFSEILLFPGFRLLFGNLYPAYASYKAVRTKNVKEYVKWMMYWIVFAFFSCIETFTDIFLAWFPFYYEVKVIIVLWLLSPATKGSSTLYRKFVHPMLTKRENEIDEYITQAKEKGYTAVLQLGSKGVNYATNVIMQTAIKGGGNLVQTLRRSYSLSDLSEPDQHRTPDEVDDIVRPHNLSTSSSRILRTRTQSTRSASGGRQVEMYFPEVDVTKPREMAVNYNYSNIRSSEDISSGYSSAEPISTGLSRTASLTNATRSRIRIKKSEDNTKYPYFIKRHSLYYPIFSEQDELEYYLNNSNNNSDSETPTTIPAHNIFNNFIEDIKNDEYFENEKFFANLHAHRRLVAQDSIPLSSISDETEDEDDDDVFLDVNDDVKIAEVTDVTEKISNIAENLKKVTDRIFSDITTQSKIDVSEENLMKNFQTPIIGGEKCDEKDMSHLKRPVSHKKGRAPPPPPPLPPPSANELLKETAI